MEHEKRAAEELEEYAINLQRKEDKDKNSQEKNERGDTIDIGDEAKSAKGRDRK